MSARKRKMDAKDNWLVLLGAGASAPLGYPLLSQLGAEETVKGDPDQSLKGFARNLDHFLVTAGDVKGIEAAIDRIDVYTTFLHQSHLDRNCTDHLFHEPRQQHGANYMISLARKLRQRLLESLYLEYSKKVDRPSAASTLTELFAHLARHNSIDNPPGVFTTNYDLSLEYLANCRSTEPTRASVTDTLKLGEAKIRYTRLHGCVAWRYKAETPTAMGTVSIWSVPENSENEAIRKMINDFDRMAIKTGTSNAEGKLDRAPFNEAYRLFEEELNECSALCVVGFGFRDRDLTRGILRALQSHRLRLIVVDKYLDKNEIIRRLTRYGPGPTDIEARVQSMRRGIEEQTCREELKQFMKVLHKPRPNPTAATATPADSPPNPDKQYDSLKIGANANT